MVPLPLQQQHLAHFAGAAIRDPVPAPGSAEPRFPRGGVVPDKFPPRLSAPFCGRVRLGNINISVWKSQQHGVTTI